MSQTFPREGKGIGDASARLLGAQGWCGMHSCNRKRGGGGSFLKALEEDEGADWAEWAIVLAS
jgi:hypothetical protein